MVTRFIIHVELEFPDTLDELEIEEQRSLLYQQAEDMTINDATAYIDVEVVERSR